MEPPSAVCISPKAAFEMKAIDLAGEDLTNISSPSTRIRSFCSERSSKSPVGGVSTVPLGVLLEQAASSTRLDSASEVERSSRLIE